MNWFWLNVPAGIFFVAAWSGIPFWLVLRHPDWAGGPPDLPHPVARPARPRAAGAPEPRHASDSRPLAKAST
jgi:hypothetical protein